MTGRRPAGVRRGVGGAAASREAAAACARGAALDAATPLFNTSLPRPAGGGARPPPPPFLATAATGARRSRWAAAPVAAARAWLQRGAGPPARARRPGRPRRGWLSISNTHKAAGRARRVPGAALGARAPNAGPMPRLPRPPAPLLPPHPTPARPNNTAHSPWGGPPSRGGRRGRGTRGRARSSRHAGAPTARGPALGRPHTTPLLDSR